MIKKVAALAGVLTAVVLLALLPFSYPSGGVALAQVSNPVIIPVSATPSGACTSIFPLMLKTPDGTLWSCQNGTFGQIGGSSSGVTTVGNSDGTLTIAPTSGTVTASLNLAHSNIWTANGALSAPAVLFNGTPVATGGTGTTTWPLVLIQPNGTTATLWNTAGTMFGVNAASGFSGNLFDFQLNGSSKLNLSSGGTLSGVTFTASAFHTFTNCSSSASPAVCAAAASGSVAVPVGGPPALLQVNTTAVTANSQILLTFDSSLGTRLGVTCNTTANQPTVSARTAGASFTISMATISTNPDCISYTIIN